MWRHQRRAAPLVGVLLVSAENRRARLSKLVPFPRPIVPVSNSLEGLPVSPNPFQLRERHSQSAPFPSNQHKHLVAALLFRGHSYRLNLIAWPQRRDCAALDATSSKGKLQPLLKVIVPSHRAFALGVRIDNDLHRDAPLARLIRGDLTHPHCRITGPAVAPALSWARSHARSASPASRFAGTRRETRTSARVPWAISRARP